MTPFAQHESQNFQTNKDDGGSSRPCCPNQACMESAPDPLQQFVNFEAGLEATGPTNEQGKRFA